MTTKNVSRFCQIVSWGQNSLAGNSSKMCNRPRPPVFICQGCHNKAPQMTSTMVIDCLTVLEPTSPKIKMVPSEESEGKSVGFLSLGFRGLAGKHSLEFLPLLIYDLFSHSAVLCMCACVQIFPLHGDTILDWGPPCLTDCIHKDVISKLGPFLRYWRWDLKLIFWKIPFNPSHHILLLQGI